METARTLLGVLFGIDPTCVSMSIIHKGRDGTWCYLHSLVSSGYSDELSKIVESKTSAFHAALEHGTVFYPDKRVALSNGCYLLDGQDLRRQYEGKEATGSIFCEDISIKLDDNRILFPAVFCINTYGGQVCAEDDNPAIDKVIDLFHGIESKIKLELARICIYEHIGIRQK